MTSGIAVYESADFGSIRMFEEDGEVYAVASDFAKSLGYASARDMTRSLEGDEKGAHIVPTLGGPQEMTVVTESGMYHAILMRRAACVKDPDMRARVEGFQRWVTHEVLPAIRRTGGYVNPQALPQAGTEEGRELMAQAVLYAQRTLAELQSENEAMRPMAALGEAVSASTDCIEVGAMARILRQNGCDWGRNDLFKHLREDGYLMDKGARHNVPYQRWIDRGLFEVQETTWPAPDGTVHVGLKTMVTPKGQAYLLRKYAGVDALPGMEIEEGDQS